MVSRLCVMHVSIIVYSYVAKNYPHIQYAWTKSIEQKHWRSKNCELIKSSDKTNQKQHCG